MCFGTNLAVHSRGVVAQQDPSHLLVNDSFSTHSKLALGDACKGPSVLISGLWEEYKEQSEHYNNRMLHVCLFFNVSNVLFLKTNMFS